MSDYPEILALPDENPFFTAIRSALVKIYALPPCAHYKRLRSGLINDTYNIDDTWILQRVNPIFGDAVNDDIAALTPYMRASGINAPILCKTTTGAYCFHGTDCGLPDGAWRLMSCLPGKTTDHAVDIEQIRSLASMLGRLHRAFDGVKYVFKHTRPGVHDFSRHLEALDRAVEVHAGHRLHGDVCAVRDRIRDLSRFIASDKVMSCETHRIIHGDPKISNFMIENGRATGVIDLDTLAESLAAFDIGDAIRSWCNPRREDEEPAFDREFAREALGVYIEETHCLTKEERSSMPDAAPFITLELAARFDRDALCEDYFGFNPDIGHGEHSLMRAQKMAELCAQML